MVENLNLHLLNQCIIFAVIQSARPASILKNRQPRGSLSFDENVHHNSHVTYSLDDGVLLKPILKKKSLSIEEKVSAVSVAHSNLNEAVKGILKTSSDKLASFSASSSRKNSTVDECAVLSISSAITQSNSTASPTKATLRGILKTSPKNRSASISPSSSFEALSDSTELERVPLPPSPKPTTRADLFSCTRRASSPDVSTPDSTMSCSDVHQLHELEAECTTSSMPSLLKANSVHASSSDSDSASPSSSPLSSSESHPSEPSLSLHQPVDSSPNDDESPPQECTEMVESDIDESIEDTVSR